MKGILQQIAQANQEQKSSEIKQLIIQHIQTQSTIIANLFKTMLVIKKYRFFLSEDVSSMDMNNSSFSLMQSIRHTILVYQQEFRNKKLKVSLAPSIELQDNDVIISQSTKFRVLFDTLIENCHRYALSNSKVLINIQVVTHALTSSGQVLKFYRVQIINQIDPSQKYALGCKPG